MSNATPPGWYADTGAPGTERWWDGAAWTAHTRPSAAVPPMPHHPRPGSPLIPQQIPPRRSGGSRDARVIAVTLSGLVIAGAAVTAAVLLGDEGGDIRPAAAPSSATPAPGATTDAGKGSTPSPADTPEDDPKVLVDQLNGITLPVPEGWEKPENTLDDATTLRTVDSYECPGDSGSYCYHGTVTTRTASGTDLTSAEALAEADIRTAADRAYGENTVGDRIHGGIRSHKEIRSTSVTVAGRTGHLVRWQVTTGNGPGGYVQSLVFPSTVGNETPVIVRFAFDAGQAGPPLSLMDTITRGIRPIGDSATGGGVGSSVGP